jgi:hypothetical protein
MPFTAPEPGFPQRISPGNPRAVASSVLLAVSAWPEAYAAADGIEAPPDAFTAADLRQAARARTSGLVAGVPGWTAILTLHDAAELDMTVPDGEELAPCATFIMHDGSRRSIADLARRALRLSADDAAWLFGADRTKTEVTGTLRRIADGRPAREVTPPRPPRTMPSARKGRTPAGSAARHRPPAR